MYRLVHMALLTFFVTSKSYGRATEMVGASRYDVMTFVFVYRMYGFFDVSDKETTAFQKYLYTRPHVSLGDFSSFIIYFFSFALTTCVNPNLTLLFAGHQPRTPCRVRRA